MLTPHTRTLRSRPSMTSGCRARVSCPSNLSALAQAGVIGNDSGGGHRPVLACAEAGSPLSREASAHNGYEGLSGL